MAESGVKGNLLYAFGEGDPVNPPNVQLIYFDTVGNRIWVSRFDLSGWIRLRTVPENP